MTCRTRWWRLEVLKVYRFWVIYDFVMYYMYGVFGSSLLIESTDSTVYDICGSSSGYEMCIVLCIIIMMCCCRTSLDEFIRSNLDKKVPPSRSVLKRTIDNRKSLSPEKAAAGIRKGSMSPLENVSMVIYLVQHVDLLCYYCFSDVYAPLWGECIQIST